MEKKSSLFTSKRMLVNLILSTFLSIDIPNVRPVRAFLKTHDLRLSMIDDVLLETTSFGQSTILPMRSRSIYSHN